MSETLRIPLRVIFYREGDRWIAHCLEFDLLGDGDTRQEAFRSLDTAIHVQIAVSLKYNNPANLFTPAEGKYHQMFAAGKAPTCKGEFVLSIAPVGNVVIEEPEYREYDSLQPA